MLRMQARRHEHAPCAHFDLACLAWAAAEWATLSYNERPYMVHRALGLVWTAWLAN